METVVSGYRVKVIEKRLVAEGTLAVDLEKPPGFTFQPGQAAECMLLNPPETDDEGDFRTFSIAAAPSQSVLTFATRLRDTAFKRVLRDMPVGSEINVDGPFGSFTLHEDASRPAVFLAGGIGITPFLSMIRDATLRAGAPSISLFYSNRRPEDAAFLEELSGIERQCPRIHVIATITQMASSAGWHGEHGVIDASMLERHLPTLDGPIYYVAGPPGMVAAMSEMLTKGGVKSDDVRTEDFGGY